LSNGAKTRPFGRNMLLALHVRGTNNSPQPLQGIVGKIEIFKE